MGMLSHADPLPTKKTHRQNENNQGRKLRTQKVTNKRMTVCNNGLS
jgi:hypothetical protein